MTLKILPAPDWTKPGRHELVESGRRKTLSYKKTIKPIFWREGRYLKNGYAWTETADGLAFEEESVHFMFDMTMYNIGEYANHKELLSALTVLRQAGLLSKKDRKLMQDIQTYINLEKNKLDSKRNVRRFKQRLLNRRQTH